MKTTTLSAGELSPAHELLASITNKVIDWAKLPNRFAELYPRVRDYVATRCFGKSVNLENEAPRSHLSRPELQEGIAKCLARKIAELTIGRPSGNGGIMADPTRFERATSAFGELCASRNPLT